MRKIHKSKLSPEKAEALLKNMFRKTKKLNKRRKKYPYAKNHLFYLNKKSRGKRITRKLINKYPRAFNKKLRKKYLRRKTRRKN